MTRWREYGNDRLYLKTFEGLDIGSIDLLSGEVEVRVPDFDSEIRALASSGNDLTENRAGAGARAKRNQVNRHAPVRNLVARVPGVKTDERA
jgi:hypothetical protein